MDPPLKPRPDQADGKFVHSVYIRIWTRLAVVACVLALTALAHGCGSGSPSSHSRPSPASSKRSPQAIVTSFSHPTNRAQAIAYARSINLRAGDVPGMATTKPEDVNHESNATKAREERCSGGPVGKHQLVDLDSASFGLHAEGETFTASSAVSVFASAQATARDFAASQTLRGHTCVENLFRRGFAREATQRIHAGRPRFTWSTHHLPGTEASYGLRVVVPLHVVHQGITVSTYLDLFGFARGSTEVTLMTSGTPAPIANTTENRLLTLLLQRSGAAGT